MTVPSSLIDDSTSNWSILRGTPRILSSHAVARSIGEVRIQPDTKVFDHVAIRSRGVATRLEQRQTRPMNFATATVGICQIHSVPPSWPRRFVTTISSAATIARPETIGSVRQGVRTSLRIYGAVPVCDANASPSSVRRASSNFSSSGSTSASSFLACCSTSPLKATKLSSNAGVDGSDASSSAST